MAQEAAAAGRAAVFVNLEVTAVARAEPHRRGNVLLGPGPVDDARGVFERVARSDSHGHLTLMAALSSDAGLQARLPQGLSEGFSRVACRTRAASRTAATAGGGTTLPARLGS